MHKQAALRFQKHQPVVGIFYLSLLQNVLNHAGYTLRGYSGPKQELKDYRKRISLNTLFTVSYRSLRNIPGGLGFDYGKKLNLVAADTVGQLIMSSGSLRQALDLLQRYHALLSVCLAINIRSEEKQSAIHFEQLYQPGAPEVLQWFFSEALLTSFVKQAEWLAGKPLPIDHVFLPYAAPAHADRYQKEFGCGVTFGADQHEIVFSSAYLDIPVVTANEELCEIKARHCEDAMQRRRHCFTTTTQVKSILAQHHPAIPGIEQVAEELNTSRSCLYRRLHEENTSYQLLINELKREESLTLLSSTMLTIAEIADKLGFSDASSFRRAFKNWTGMQPSSFRQLKQL